MSSCRVHTGNCTAKQLQRFLLLAMGIRFEEIRKVQPEAGENLLYLPRTEWGRYYRGRRWRVEFEGSAPWSWIAIKGKALGIRGFPTERMHKLEKTSKSGNELRVTMESFTDMTFSVAVEQQEGKKPSNWFWMWRAVGVGLVAA